MANRIVQQAMSRQRGAGLIEVLVTVLILATSLLAMGALQNRSLQFNHSAYLRSQANLLAYDILDRVRINSDEFEAYSHDLGDDAPGGGDVTNADISDWLNAVAGTLPGGEGGIDCEDATWVCTVTIRWIDDDRLAAEIDEDAAQETTTFTYSTRVRAK
ncbi:type IV pilus modification protein PilV [Marinimicrobium sp. C6131]|uniref:type IV pilus modification protein PilV n=1 Tax=Marinimicrobium sp. C6131 TaxID=3022676 RepID=UPI00223CC26D|nr:type IV pilus modification protein PilV [Marinimicrobium sp. C6131]UZJ44687.1 type IV pilus modification protein PilV [Marinimicrobium sp. C6131]